jgi:hypothetical protein
MLAHLPSVMRLPLFFIKPLWLKLFFFSCFGRCPEVLFDPNLIGLEAKGIHFLVNDTIGKCDIDVRRSVRTIN